MKWRKKNKDQISSLFNDLHAGDIIDLFGSPKLCGMPFLKIVVASVNFLPMSSSDYYISVYDVQGDRYTIDFTWTLNDNIAVSIVDRTRNIGYQVNRDTEYILSINGTVINPEKYDI